MLGKLFKHEAAGGVVLFIAAALALFMDNSAWSGAYDALLSKKVTVAIDTFTIDKPLLLWINDGLMAIFFLYVGLEIKRELLEGKLKDPKDVMLPGAAAVGGMAVPAAIFLLITAPDTVLMNGWAIPAATDIAFALGVLALLGKAVPPALKVFLLTLAIIDDLGAIIIIAAFYTADLSIVSLITGVVVLSILCVFNYLGVRRIALYLLVGVVGWAFVLKSGVHATLAGVLIALTIPMRCSDGTSPLVNLEHGLKPYVAFAIMPIFAFANAGVSLDGFSLQTLMAPLPLGIALGLLIGKPIGVFLCSFLVVKSGLTKLPEGVNWGMVLGVGFIAGIGFTMSLFIGILAFADPAHAAGVRFGVLSGSTVAAILGYILVKISLPKPASVQAEVGEAAKA